MQPPISADLQFQVYLHGGLIETNNSHHTLREETVELFTWPNFPTYVNTIKCTYMLKKKHAMLGNAFSTQSKVMCPIHPSRHYTTEEVQIKPTPFQSPNN
jgi:hypothetical protein